jgi:polyisoprenoid-binding protein YceI
MATFDADSPEARKYVGLNGETNESTRKQVNANMLGKDVLNVAQFPTASLKIDSALPLSPAPGANSPRFELNGSFTLHGVTNPVKLVCEATPQKEGLRLRTGFTVLQTDYGMKPYTAAYGAVGVANELKVWGDLLLATDGR